MELVSGGSAINGPTPSSFLMCRSVMSIFSLVPVMTPNIQCFENKFKIFIELDLRPIQSSSSDVHMRVCLFIPSL